MEKNLKNNCRKKLADGVRGQDGALQTNSITKIITDSITKIMTKEHTQHCNGGMYDVLLP